MKYIILGTAGHIDHGKSSLVKALTGTDPDRLKEEKERGITLDLGFASLDLPGGNLLGIIDVPGHEGLIKNMLAGVGGIDIVMLVIAADEGIMPQTREHLAICDLLHVKKGIIAITKTDMVEKDWLVLVQDEVRDFVKGTFLEKSTIVPVSSKTGDNLPMLVQELAKLSNEVAPKSLNGILRLPIDRVFTMKGFGTVITGTLLSGTISTDQEIEILPKGITTKIRGIQSHNQAVQRSVAGQRTAVNLQGVEKDQLSRGDTIVSAGYFQPTKTLDAKLDLLKQAPRGIKTGARIRFYNTTQEAIGRITVLGSNMLAPGEAAYVQLRLEQPVIVQHGDRYILRFYSPMETLGGGMVLNPHTRRYKTATMQESLKDLGMLEEGSLEEILGLFISNKGLAGMEEADIIGAVVADKQSILSALAALTQKKTALRIDNLYVHATHLGGLEKKIVDFIKQFHRDNPLKPGLDKEELKGMLRMRLSAKILNLTIEGLVKKKPRDAQLQYALGAVLYLEANLTEAAVHLQESIRLQPDQLAPYYYLALVTRDQGNDAGAIQRLQDLLRRYPDHALSYEALGSLLMSANRYAEAETSLETAIRLNPKSVKANYQLGLLLSRMGKKSEADKQLELSKTLRTEDEANSRLQLRLLDPDR